METRFLFTNVCAKKESWKLKCKSVFFTFFWATHNVIYIKTVFYNHGKHQHSTAFHLVPLFMLCGVGNDTLLHNFTVNFRLFLKVHKGHLFWSKQFCVPIFCANVGAVIYKRTGSRPKCLVKWKKDSYIATCVFWIYIYTVVAG